MTFLLDVISYNFKASELTIFRDNDALISGLSCNLNSGNCCIISGSNGIGKSTLLRAIAGLRSSFVGSISLSKDDIRISKEDINNHIAYQGHKIGISENLTVKDNIHFFSGLYNSDLKKTDFFIRQFSLSGLLNRKVDSLSAGEQKRVAIVCAFLKNASFWLLDEPSINLDADGCSALNLFIKQKLKQGSIFLIATHNLNQFKEIGTHQLELDSS